LIPYAANHAWHEAARGSRVGLAALPSVMARRLGRPSLHAAWSIVMRTGAPRLPHSVGFVLRAVALAALLSGFAGNARADDAQWIWAPQAPEGGPRTAYFRRVFEMGRPESGTVEIAADERYELFVNGRSIGKGTNWRSLDNYDITTALVPGRNVIAVE